MGHIGISNNINFGWLRIEPVFTPDLDVDIPWSFSRLLIDLISSRQTLKSSQYGLGLWWWDLWDGPKG
jgi:hypothetical protein